MKWLTHALTAGALVASFLGADVMAAPQEITQLTPIQIAYVENPAEARAVEDLLRENRADAQAELDDVMAKASEATEEAEQIKKVQQKLNKTLTVYEKLLARFINRKAACIGHQKRFEQNDPNSMPWEIRSNYEREIKLCNVQAEKAKRRLNTLDGVAQKMLEVLEFNGFKLMEIKDTIAMYKTIADALSAETEAYDTFTEM